MYRILSLCLLLLTVAIASPKTRILKNRYGKYCVPAHHHRPAIDKTKKGRVHEHGTLLAMQEHYVKGTSIIHAGAYFGDMLPFFSRLVQEQTVWAFEPVKLHYECAKKTLQLNGLNNVKLYNFGLSSSEKECQMVTKLHSVSLGGSSHITDDPSQDQAVYEAIQTVTIDQMISGSDESIGIIHLDVEDHEIEALKGACQTIKNHKPLIVIEVHSYQKDAITSYMNSIGYRYLLSRNQNKFYVTNN